MMSFIFGNEGCLKINLTPAATQERYMNQCETEDTPEVIEDFNQTEYTSVMEDLNRAILGHTTLLS
jgi:hypothetical protein